MKRYRIVVILCILSLSAAFTQSHADGKVTFANYFANQTLRIDYYHMGDNNLEYISLDRLFLQGMWSGNPDSLIDEFNNGQYYAKVYELASNNLIFSRGFNSYFGEYKTTDTAAGGIKRTYHETVLIPCPKTKVRFVIESRNRQNLLKPIFSVEIDPQSIEINRESLIEGVKVFELLKNGHPHRQVDMAFIAEGYDKTEEEKFVQDLKTAAQIFFNQEPYKTNKEKFNIYGVFKPSQDSGCDEPRRGIYKRTVLHASFNSLGLSRYLLTEGNRELRDIAAHVPYDALVIMVNSDRYGGGGIYNSFCVFTAHSDQKAYLLVHEFGHSFANLADEYYSSSVSYDEFYRPGLEPTEANITALLNPAELKWKHLASTGIEIPTKWEKDTYEKMAAAFQGTRQKLNQEIERLVLEGAARAEISRLKEKLEHFVRENSGQIDAFLASSPMSGKVGAFEGAGYSAKGIFRPMLNCIMFTIGTKPFCKVCQAAVSRVIDYFTK